MKPTTKAILPLQSEANYQSAVATTVVMKPTTKAMLPLQSEANYQSAVTTTVVMKPTTKAMLPLQLWWSQLPKRFCHYSLKPTTKALLPLQSWWSQLPKRCRQNYRDTAAHQCYRQHCSSSMFISASFIRPHSPHFLSVTQQCSCCALRDVPLRHSLTLQSVTPVTSHSAHSEESFANMSSRYVPPYVYMHVCV